MAFSNFFHDGLQPILADMALAIDQQGRTDLDNDAVPVSRVEAFYSGDHAVSSPSSGSLVRPSSPSRGMTWSSSVGIPAPVAPEIEYNSSAPASRSCTAKSSITSAPSPSIGRAACKA